MQDFILAMAYVADVADIVFVAWRTKVLVSFAEIYHDHVRHWMKVHALSSQSLTVGLTANAAPAHSPHLPL